MLLTIHALFNYTINHVTSANTLFSRRVLTKPDVKLSILKNIYKKTAAFVVRRDHHKKKKK